MRVLYLDCFSGISGDMFLGALLDLGLEFEVLKKELNKLKLEGMYEIEIKKTKRNGISATRFMSREREKVERGLKEIKEIIDESELELDVKERAKKMFEKLHRVERKIHGENHGFHELGLIDTVIDVVGAIVALKILKVEKIFSSKINTGKGFVKCRHGILPVPAPATLELLKGIPVYSTNIESELVTPTGALILSEFVQEFKMPEMRIERIGYGAGGKQLENHPNVLRMYLGEMEEKKAEKILVETNIDDLNPELYDYVMEKLFSKGALDVYYTPIHMKKNRPGILLSCLCTENERDGIVETIFKETTTLGVRILHPERIELERFNRKIETRYGEVEVKISKYKSKITNIAPEYESCKKLAEKTGVSLKEIYHEAEKRAREELGEFFEK